MRPTAANADLRPFHMSCRSASSRGTRISSAPAPRAISMARAETCSTSARGPSASMRSAAPTSGQSSPVAAFAATIASRSIISIAAGQDARRDDAGDRRARLVRGGERREEGPRRLRLAQEPDA